MILLLHDHPLLQNKNDLCWVCWGHVDDMSPRHNNVAEFWWHVQCCAISLYQSHITCASHVSGWSICLNTSVCSMSAWHVFSVSLRTLEKKCLHDMSQRHFVTCLTCQQTCQANIVLGPYVMSQTYQSCYWCTQFQNSQVRYELRYCYGRFLNLGTTL